LLLSAALLREFAYCWAIQSAESSIGVDLDSGLVAPARRKLARQPLDPYEFAFPSS